MTTSAPKTTEAHVTWRLVLTSVLILGSVSSSIATTIVAVAGPSVVALGVDSRIAGMKPSQEISDLGCKIERINNVFVAAAGVWGESKPGGFNVFNIVEKAWIDGDRAVDIADRFEREAERPFNAFIKRFREENPGDFEKSCSNRHCLSAVFIGFANGRGELSVRSFMVTTTSMSTVVTTAPHMDCPGNCETGGLQAILGVNAEATAITDRTPHFWKLKGFIGGMEELIGEEATRHPEAVSLPISILIVDPTGPHWAPGHQGMCPEISGQQPARRIEPTQNDK